MLALLIVWLALFLALIMFAVGRPRQGGALTLAYFVGLSLIHVPGVLPFLGDAPGLGDRDVTRIGFELTLLGMGAFVSGAVAARAIAGARIARRAAMTAIDADTLGRVGWRMLIAGAITYFFLIPLSFRVPSLTAAVSAFATLLIVGVWLVLYRAVLVSERGRAVATVALLPLLPLATLVTGGFLGYGIYWVLSIMAFLFVIVVWRHWFYITAPIVAFLGLSLFVTYMGQRAGIRELVWEKQAGISDRLDRVSRIVTDFELLDLDAPEDVEALNGRLNQNWLVGTAVDRHGDGLTQFAHGGTVPLWAFVPRALWANKPVVGGGGDLVSDFTGITFGQGTSVGAGQVLEFYVNFGIAGVVIGFALWGFVLMRLDHGIMHALEVGDMRGLVLRAMPGLTLLQPGGNLLEIVVAFVASLMAAWLISRFKFFVMVKPIRPQPGRFGEARSAPAATAR
jgi:hypothetical protein